MEWKTIIDFPNYEINNLGDVKNTLRGKILKTTVSTDGYSHVGLYTNGKRKHYNIHRLIAIHFIPNPENKPCIDHINRIKTDNRLQNLRWVTYAENNQNVSIHKDNKLKEQNICEDKNCYKFQKVINGLKHTKRFKTLHETIEYRDQYISI